MEVEFYSSRDDLWQLAKYMYVRRFRSKGAAYAFFVVLPFVMFSPFCTFSLMITRNEPVSIGIGLGSMLTVPLFTWCYRYAVRKQASNMPGWVGRRTMRIDHNGIWAKTTVSEALTKWDAIKEIVDSDQYIYLFMNKSAAFIVPRRAFADQNEAQRFLEAARGYWNAVKERATSLGNR